MRVAPAWRSYRIRSTILNIGMPAGIHTRPTPATSLQQSRPRLVFGAGLMFLYLPRLRRRGVLPQAWRLTVGLPRPEMTVSGTFADHGES